MRAGYTELSRLRLTVNTGQRCLAPACSPVWRGALLQSIFKRPETFAHAAVALHFFPDAAA
jgi:hypothetical protein